MTLPLVSVAIPAYNHAKFIEACLSSVCAQTYPELELVLLDDGSTDDTFGVAKQFLDAHSSRFRRIVLERRANQGVSANSNACIEACTGEWVHLLGSDDVLYPEKISRIQQAIAEYDCPDLALVHADVDFINEDGAPHVRQPRWARPKPGPDREAYRWLFSGKHVVFNPSVTLRRNPFMEIGGFDKNLPLEDVDCWLRLSTNHAIAYLPEVLARYRKHPGNSLRQRIKMLGALFVTYAKFLDKHGALITDEHVAIHFRKNLHRFWRRIRGKKPWLLPLVIYAKLRSFIVTPTATDYRSFGAILNHCL